MARGARFNMGFEDIQPPELMMKNTRKVFGHLGGVDALGLTNRNDLVIHIGDIAQVQDLNPAILKHPADHIRGSAPHGHGQSALALALWAHSCTYQRGVYPQAHHQESAGQSGVSACYKGAFAHGNWFTQAAP